MNKELMRLDASALFSLRPGESQPRIKVGASHHVQRGKNVEAFLIRCD